LTLDGKNNDKPNQQPSDRQSKILEMDKNQHVGTIEEDEPIFGIKAARY
jgi:hypothetical protein